MSETMLVESGIPQGSILGPLFYTIYTNKLPETIVEDDCKNPAHRNKSTLFGENCKHCGSVPFADDMTYVVETRNREASQLKVFSATERIKNFLNSQDLVVNLSKTTLLESMVKQKRTHLKWDQPSLSTLMETGEPKTIHLDKSIRLLGVNIEQNLAWNSHLLTGEKSSNTCLQETIGITETHKQPNSKEEQACPCQWAYNKQDFIYSIALWGDLHDKYKKNPENYEQNGPLGK